MDKIAIDFWGFAITAEGFYGVVTAALLVAVIVALLRFAQLRDRR